MTRHPRLSAAVTGIAAWVVACAAGQPDRPPAGGNRAVGNAGCAAANCHGRPAAPSLTGPPLPDCWRSSHTHWTAADPHREAFSALETPLARKMIARLAKGDGSFKPAAEEPRCLACHTNPALALAPPPVGQLRAEGTGCEGCHGNAEKWLGPHTRRKPTAEFASLGMTPLDDPGQRATMCAGCHVGAPAAPGVPVRDMNHDMIAAGHPRLNFDPWVYTRRMRPHWYDPPGSAIREWLAGRIAVAEVMSNLHADRERRGVLPELSESNCFACHHGLKPGDWRGGAKGYYSGRKPGELPGRRTWPAVKPGVPSGDGPTPAEFLDLIRVEGAALDRLDWDSACDLYHALRAAAADLKSAGAPPEFVELARLLTLPRAAGTQTDSPTDYTPARVKPAFERLQKSLAAAARKP